MASPILGCLAARTGLTSCGVSILRDICSSAKTYATEAVASRKDVLYMLQNTEDPETAAAVKAYLREQHKAGAKAETPSLEDTQSLAAKIEKKYKAAQIVEYGLQNVSVPLSWDLDGNDAAVKRYTAQLLKLGEQAGYENPAKEVSKRLQDQGRTADTVKELLGRVKPYVTPDFHAALLDAVQQIENETNSTVVCDGASDGYKRFAEKVKAVAAAHNIPWKLLVDAEKTGATKEYSAWLQAAVVADAKTEIEGLKSEATTLLDKHLSKSAEQVRKEQEAAQASLLRKIESAKGAKWAQQFQEDLKYVQWFDSAVAADPVAGPKVAL